MKHRDLQVIFNESAIHRAEHKCGGYPYEYGQILTSLVAATHSTKILEFGTGLGYTAICLALGNDSAHIDTIERDESHLKIAQRNWKLFNLNERITALDSKAEVIIPTLEEQYDLIFFDGYAPSMKFLVHFDRLLKVNGVLITANLFVKDPKGGKYLRALQRGNKWHTGTFADTAISVKRH